VLEAVPNVSEGRDRRVIAEIGQAFGSTSVLLDVHSDPDHNRSVFTVAGGAADIEEALLAGVERACELIDLRAHRGAHPRVGVVDVVPVVAVEPGSEGRESARTTGLAVAGRIGSELSLPVFLYGEIGLGRRPAFFRRGGPGELQRRVDAGELEPDFGPRRLHTRSGAVLVGVREFLVAYNVVLGTSDAAVARSIAETIRESNGGMRGVQAIGVGLPARERVQVSMNVVDVDLAPLQDVVARVRELAAAQGVNVEEGELVGLVPEKVLGAIEAAGAHVQGVDGSKALERRIAREIAGEDGEIE
jgi:glutamate formiminotransferase